MQSKDFHTRKKHNDGVRLYLPDSSGKLTDAWLQVRGLDSDAYRSAHDATNRAMVRLAAAVRAKADATLLAETQAEKDAALLAARVALVSAWSFEEACTPENVTTLLQEAPYLSDQVYYTALDRDRFLESASPISSDGPNTNSDLTSQQLQTPDKPSPSL